MKIELIKEIFEKSKRDKKLIGIWTYSDDEGFWSGYVTNYNDDFVQIQHFTKYGKSDGLLIELISNIESIDFDDDYSDCLAYLIKNNVKLDEDDQISQNLPSCENWQFEYLNNHVGKKDRIARIEIKEDISYTGFINKIDKEMIILHVIGKLGENEGLSMFKLEDISNVRINDIENRKRLMLFNKKSL